MLKNTIDENFWFSQVNMRSQIIALAKACYRERLQTKLVTDVHKHVDEVL